MARRPVQRVTRPRARSPAGLVNDAEAQLARHIRMCDRCTRARGDAVRFCDDGWEQAKALSRLRAAARRHAERNGQAPGQGTLW